MLRLLTSDLVLDEPDDFDLADLPALSRLLHWAGLLGSRVLLSSATLAPALVEGLFCAYLAGRIEYQRNRGGSGRPPAVSCAWFDEHRAEHGAHAEAKDFALAHRDFVRRRIVSLGGNQVRQRAEIVPVAVESGRDPAAHWAEQILAYVARLHAEHHDTDSATGRRVSVGLVRMANIGPLVRTATALLGAEAPVGHRLHLCCYHSQHPLLMRSAIEGRLDRLLNRIQRKSLFEDPDLRRALSAHSEIDQVFLVLATPVAEVGRDHDYDWAVVEPSSMRSIIQLAGRVRRHRPAPYERTNVLLLDRNFRALTGGDGPAFCRPGFESRDWPLTSHRLDDLLAPDQYCEISAAPRIAQRAALRPQENLVDLEHARLRALMLGAGDSARKDRSVPVSWWWETPAHLTGVLQRAQPFRSGPPTTTFVLMPDEDAATVTFMRKERDSALSDQSNDLDRIKDPDLLRSATIRPWPEIAYLDELHDLADDFGLSLQDAARHFGWVELPCWQDRPRWRYHPALGFDTVA